MQLVYRSGAGEVTLNYMWLPSWLGMNSAFKTRIEADLNAKMAGIPMDPVGFQTMHEIVVNAIVAEFPQIQGLRDYLDAIKFVTLPEAT